MKGAALTSIILCASLGPLWLVPSVHPQEFLQDFELVKKVLVVASTPWTDSGIAVKKGQELYFEAEGTISLQRDNPISVCGPEGLNLRTMQQPLYDQNLGALICRVREKVEASEDKQTGEKTSRDVGEVFFIGKENRLLLPKEGRLLLGVNENVSGDNDGGFEVKIYLRKFRPQG
ncbi:MAG: hypothetical protein Q8O91_12185 [Candidatus Aminicenantes bacterium]|nr:hypothetical protein [Candidatus Aminicenantes bacterium]